MRTSCIPGTNQLLLPHSTESFVYMCSCKTCMMYCTPILLIYIIGIIGCTSLYFLLWFLSPVFYRSMHVVLCMFCPIFSLAAQDSLVCFSTVHQPDSPRVEPGGSQAAYSCHCHK